MKRNATKDTSYYIGDEVENTAVSVCEKVLL